MLKIIGDVNFADWYFDTGRGVGTAIRNGDDPFKFLNRNDNDLWIGNFECVCANIADKTFPFVISPDYLSGIKHLDFYGVANNHIMQAGEDAFNQTCTFLNGIGIPYAGSTIQRSYTFIHQGKEIGIMAFSQRPDNFTSDPLYWHVPEYSEIKHEIENLKGCDYKIAFIHWGYEFINYPNIDQKLLAHWLIDTGIDLVVGMHPHVSQGMEEYKGKHIFYSLGNAVFNMNWEPTKHGLIINVDFDSGVPEIAVEYLTIDDKGFPHPDFKPSAEYTIEHLNSLIAINVENEKYFAKAQASSDKFRKENRKKFIQDIISGKNPYAMRMLSDFFHRRILKKS